MMMMLTDLFSYWDGTQSLSLEPLTLLGTLSTEQEGEFPAQGASPQALSQGVSPTASM